MTEKNGILDYVTKAAERAAKAETFLEAIAVYVSTENYPEKSTICALTRPECKTDPFSCIWRPFEAV